MQSVVEGQALGRVPRWDTTSRSRVLRARTARAGRCLQVARTVQLPASPAWPWCAPSGVTRLPCACRSRRRPPYVVTQIDVERASEEGHVPDLASAAFLKPLVAGLDGPS